MSSPEPLGELTSLFAEARFSEHPLGQGQRAERSPRWKRHDPIDGAGMIRRLVQLVILSFVATTALVASVPEKRTATMRLELWVLAALAGRCFSTSPGTAFRSLRIPRERRSRRSRRASRTRWRRSQSRSLSRVDL